MIFATSTISDGNMDFRFGVHNNVLKNRQKFLKKLHIPFDRVVETEQVHGANVTLVTKNDLEKVIPQTDGLITNEKDIYLMIRVADCHQIAFYDPKNQAIGIIHAGWQGLDKGILKNLIHQMHHNFSTSPVDLLVQFGPAIGPCCYNRLPDLQQKNNPKWQPYITQSANGTYAIDLWRFAEDELVNLGIQTENIKNPRVCTKHNTNFFSHRRNGAQSQGRFISILGLTS